MSGYHRPAIRAKGYSYTAIYTYLYAYNAKFFIKFNSPHISITDHLVIWCPSMTIMKGSTVVAADAK